MVYVSMINRVKGTQDFLDLTLFNYLIQQARRHLALYHFTEIATPILEQTELFVRSLGQETDVIGKEMYFVHTVHASEEQEQICLRPELTAPIVRAFINAGDRATPWKVFTYGPVFRHERPQKGRYRQFHQISIEVIGTTAIEQDVYFITMLDRFFSEALKLDSYALLINFLGCLADRAVFKKILAEFLSTHEAQLCATCLKRKDSNILRIFDCKNPACQELYRSAPKIVQTLCAGCAAEWQTLQDQLHQLSVSFSINPSLVRGLDYYDKTVFEFVSHELGAQNAFCGGGRYEKLASLLGAIQDQPSIGAGIGIERLLLLLEPIKDRLPLPEMPALTCVIPVTPEQQSLALQLIDHLHAYEICADILLEGSIKSMLRKANKLGAQYCIIIGSDEQATRTVKLKNMLLGTEEVVTQKDLINKLKNSNQKSNVL